MGFHSHDTVPAQLVLVTVLSPLSSEFEDPSRSLGSVDISGLGALDALDTPKSKKEKIRKVKKEKIKLRNEKKNKEKDKIRQDKKRKEKGK